mgnify:CR=1 FL=1
MSFPNRDAQILAHILEYCNRVEKTLSRFGRNFDIFLEDQDYMDSVSMNLLQIGELAGKFSDAYVQETKPQMDWRAIKNMRNMFAHDYGSMDKDRLLLWGKFYVLCQNAPPVTVMSDRNFVHGHPAYDPLPAASA